MIDQLYDRIWNLGLWLRNRAKNLSLLGPIEPAMVRLGTLVVPAPKIERLVRLPNGMRMKVPPGVPAARSYSSGSYEPELTRFFMSIVRQGMTVVDAGANIGYYTLLASSLAGALGRVYAFEPDPANHSYLLENVVANGCPNVTAVNKALSSTTSTAKFIQDPNGAEGFLTEAVDNPVALDVATIGLDQFFESEGWPTVHIMKMDIEGGEKRALEGMQELSRRNPEMQLIMELNAPATLRSGSTIDAIRDLLRELGFVRGYVVEAGHRPFSLSDKLPTSQATYNLLFLKQAA